jgi:hypothetical protein
MIDDISAQLERMQQERKRIAEEEDALRDRAEVELSKITEEMAALQARRSLLEDFIGKGASVRRNGVQATLLQIIKDSVTPLSNQQVTDFAKAQGVNPASISSGISNLIQKNLATRDRDGRLAAT